MTSGQQGSALEWVAGCDERLSRGAEEIARAHTGSGIAVQDAGGAIVGANPRAAQLLGLTWDQLIGRTSMDGRWSAVSEDGLPLLGDQHPAMVSLRTGEVVRGFLMGVMAPIDVGELGRALARTQWIEIASYPVIAADGPVLGVVAVFEDATDSARGRAASDVQLAAFQLVIQNADDVVVRTDDAGTVRWVSLSIDRELGWRPADLVGRRIDDLVHPDDRERLSVLRERMHGSSEDEAAPREEFRIALPHDGWRWVSDAGRLLRDRDLGIAGELHTMRDIDNEVTARRALAESEERYRLLAENASDVVVHIRNDIIDWVSPSVEAALGGRAEDWIGRRIDDLVSAEDRDRQNRDLQLLATQPSVVTRFRMADRSGRMHWLEGHSRRYLGRMGEPDGYIVSIRVVDDIVAAERTLERQAMYDSLTGLLNRAEAMDAVSRLVGDDRRTGASIAALFCDLDGFKEVNDTHGHAAGDEVLRVLADRIGTRIRKGDLAARIGGDEMLVILVGVRDAADAMAIAEQIREAAALPVNIAGGQVSTSLSIGVTLAEPGEGTDELVARADRAMYRAKQTGRNQVVLL